MTHFLSKVNLRPAATNRFIKKETGVTLVEVMVSLALGLVILAGVSMVFVNNLHTRKEIENSSRQIENGRYAMQLLNDDLQNSGFYGVFDPTAISTPGTLPDPCVYDLTSLNANVALHIQGIDNATGSTLTCTPDLKAGTDILVVRRASTCAAGATNCDAIKPDYPYFQASQCNNSDELGSGIVSKFYKITSAQAALTLTKQNCTSIAEIYLYRTNIYYIANNNIGSDGVTTLKKVEIKTNGNHNVQPLVEGIEQLQFEYGIDSDTNNDGIPDNYTANPTSYNGCSTTPAKCVENWRNAMTVRIALLARNTEITAGYNDEKTYVFGSNADGTENSYTPSADTANPSNKNYKRHAYTAIVRMNNPAGRREVP